MSIKNLTIEPTETILINGELYKYEDGNLSKIKVTPDTVEPVEKENVVDLRTLEVGDTYKTRNERVFTVETIGVPSEERYDLSIKSKVEDRSYYYKFNGCFLDGGERCMFDIIEVIKAEKPTEIAKRIEQAYEKEGINPTEYPYCAKDWENNWYAYRGKPLFYRTPEKWALVEDNILLLDGSFIDPNNEVIPSESLHEWKP